MRLSERRDVGQRFVGHGDAVGAQPPDREVEVLGVTGEPAPLHSRRRYERPASGCRPARPQFAKPLYARASRIMLNGVSAALRTVPNPPAVITSRSFASPACAPSAAPTSCDSEVGTQIIVEPA